MKVIVLRVLMAILVAASLAVSIGVTVSCDTGTIPCDTGTIPTTSEREYIFPQLPPQETAPVKLVYRRGMSLVIPDIFFTTVDGQSVAVSMSTDENGIIKYTCTDNVAYAYMVSHPMGSNGPLEGIGQWDVVLGYRLLVAVLLRDGRVYVWCIYSEQPTLEGSALSIRQNMLEHCVYMYSISQSDFPLKPNTILYREGAGYEAKVGCSGGGFYYNITTLEVLSWETILSSNNVPGKENIFPWLKQSAEAEAILEAGRLGLYPDYAG